MIDKRMVRVLWVAALTTMITGTAMADFIPPAGLTPGSQYQIAFVTADTTSGTSGSESYYNSFVQAEAAMSPSLPGGSSWTAITSTYDGTNYHNASDNAPSYPNYPIYNTQGQEVASGSGALWSGGLGNPIQYDQNGTSIGFAGVWSGTKISGNAGVALPGYALGQTTTTFGFSTSVTGTWIDASLGAGGGTSSFYDGYHVYALSSPITVPVPEPATVTLLCSALLGLGFVHLRRRRAKA